MHQQDSCGSWTFHASHLRLVQRAGQAGVGEQRVRLPGQLLNGASEGGQVVRGLLYGQQVRRELQRRGTATLLIGKGQYPILLNL